MSIAQWAKEKAHEQLESIKSYIDEGISKEEALKMVLETSTLGTPWKSQIAYEIKYYESKTK